MIGAALLLACLAGPAAAASLSQTAERQLDIGARQLYDLDYEASRASFRKIIEAEPDNPFGYLFEAGQIWWQSAAEYGLFQGTPTLQGLFEQDVEAALRKSQPMLKSKDSAVRADGYFASGMAYGVKGQWELFRGHYLQAYFSGKKAVKHLKKCLKIDKDYYDAYMGLGIYDYQTGHLPGVLKLSFLLGIHGDVKRGLERLELAAEKGRYSGRQAAQFLASIYTIDEHDYARALPIVERLRRDFPESAYFEFLELYLRHRLGDWDGSYAAATRLFGRMKSQPRASRQKLLSLICGLTMDKCLEAQVIGPALPWFQRALEAASFQPDGWTAFLHICAGQKIGRASCRERVS
jgi:tetratricopeptide (TPR) repeat protein